MFFFSVLFSNEFHKRMKLCIGIFLSMTSFYVYQRGHSKCGSVEDFLKIMLEKIKEAYLQQKRNSCFKDFFPVFCVGG